jgi:hypothetical protein
MTGSGRYGCQTEPMMNIELARILQNDREREIEQELRVRRLLRPADTTESIRNDSSPTARVQRPASCAAVCR